MSAHIHKLSKQIEVADNKFDQYMAQTQNTLNQHDQFITAATQQMMRLTTSLDNTNTSITNLHTQFITSQDKMNATLQQLVNNHSPNTGSQQQYDHL